VEVSLGAFTVLLRPKSLFNLILLQLTQRGAALALALLYVSENEWSPPLVRAWFFAALSFAFPGFHFAVLVVGCFALHLVFFSSHLEMLSFSLSWLSFLLSRLIGHCLEKAGWRVFREVPTFFLIQMCLQLTVLNSSLSVGRLILLSLPQTVLALAFERVLLPVGGWWLWLSLWVPATALQVFQPHLGLLEDALLGLLRAIRYIQG
jgi:hypothetical protein